MAKLPRRTLLGVAAALPLAGAAAQDQGRGIRPAAEPQPAPPPSRAGPSGGAPSGRASPGQTPILMPGTAMHVGPIRAIAVSADGSIVVTGGADRCIRLWSAKTGEDLLRLSLPLGEGSVGAVDALALSPDGRTLYASGLDWAAPSGSSQGMVYVFDLAAGKLTGLMAWPPAFGSRLRHLAVSPNGRQIAIAAGNNGLIVRDTAAPAYALRLSEPANPAFATSAVAYAPDGALLATAATNGRLRLFAVGADGAVTEAQSRMLPGGGQVNSLAFSPDGVRLAVGFIDRPSVLVLGVASGEAATLTAPTGASRGNLAAVGWGRDDARRPWLLAGGTMVDAAGRNIVLAWPDGRPGPAQPLAVAQDSITVIAPQPRGGVVFASSDPRWGWLAPGPAGLRPHLAFATERLDFRGVAARAWGIDDAAETIEFQGPGIPLRFDLNELTLGPATPSPLYRPRPAPPSHSPSPGVVLPRGATLRSLDRAPDGQVLAGTDDYLILADPAGRELARRELATAAWGVAIARRRPIAVAAHGDGSLRWYALDRGLAELGGLFVTADGQRWIAWRADGAFAHSAGGGAKLVGFQQNGTFEPGRVADGALTGQWLGIDQFYRRLYDPDAVRHMLRPGAAAPAAPALPPARLPAIEIRSLCPTEERGAETRGIRARQAMDGAPDGALPGAVTGPPTGASADTPARQATADGPDPAAAAVGAVATSLVTANACRALEGAARPGDTITLPRGTTALRVRLQVEGADAATQVAAFVNEQNVGRAVVGSSASRGIRAVALEQYVPLFPGDNRVEFRAYDATGRDFTRAPMLLRIAVGRGAAASGSGQPAAPAPRRPTLRALVVGVDAYGGGIQRLRFARADARAFADALERRGAREYGQPAVTTLFDQAATLPAVTAGLAAIAAAAQPEDAVVIYLAGHGVVGTADHAYAFLTADVADANTALRGGTGLAADRLANGLAEIRAERVFVFLDTCFAGAFDPRTIGYLNHDTGRYVLAASTRLEEALDGFDGRNGLFAHAVKEGMDGGINGGINGGAGRSIDAFDLGRFVTTRVEALAQQRAWQQRAVFQAAGRITAFPLVAPAGI